MRRAMPPKPTCFPSRSSRFSFASVGVTIVTFFWSGIVAAISYKLVDWTIGLRVSEEDEREGLDTSAHGEAAYRM